MKRRRERQRERYTPVDYQWPILLLDDIFDYFRLEDFLEVFVD